MPNMHTASFIYTELKILVNEIYVWLTYGPHGPHISTPPGVVYTFTPHLTEQTLVHITLHYNMNILASVHRAHRNANTVLKEKIVLARITRTYSGTRIDWQPASCSSRSRQHLRPLNTITELSRTPLSWKAHLYSFAVERGRLDKVAFFNNSPSAHDGPSATEFVSTVARQAEVPREQSIFALDTLPAGR